MESALIVGDIQVPCHDPDAWSVMLQIGEDLKPDIAIINGDFVEWRHLSTHYAARDLEKFGKTISEETSTAKEMLNEFAVRIPAKRKVFNEGNHEWRLFRALGQVPQVLKLLGIKELQRELTTDAVLGISKLGFSYSGEYPAGTWCFGGSHDNDVFVHHSFLTRAKAGYMAHSEIDKRLCSTVTGHGERLAVVWRRGMDRELFSCEGGNLSILGVPKKGQGIYTSVPFNQPEFMDRQQGFIVLYKDGKYVWPVPVAIHNGRAVFHGKLYRA